MPLPSIMTGATEGAALSSYSTANGTNAIQEFLRGVQPDFVPDWALPVTAAGIGVGIAVAIISLLAMSLTWLERKVAGHIQCRYGPMRVGWHGVLQPIADGVKLMLKEDMIPKGADKVLFVLGPAVVLAGIFGAFVALPLTPSLYFADMNLGVFMVLALASTTTIGVIMAGWSSNSKWSLYGAMREAAQVVAYEIPLGISLLVPLLVSGTLNPLEASADQAGFFGMDWYIFRNPFMVPAFILFFIAVLAENKRAPFDLPESESELVSGFLTEYSGIRWSFFFMEEYSAMFLFSVIGSFFFFGGFNSPFSHIAAESLGAEHFVTQGIAFATMVVKGILGVVLMMWVRWTLPRIRIDQIMTMGYKYLTPLALACVLGTVAWEFGWHQMFGAK